MWLEFEELVHDIELQFNIKLQLMFEFELDLFRQNLISKLY